MEFDCWTGLRIEGKPYIIVEKIRYRDPVRQRHNTGKYWFEYGLKPHLEDMTEIKGQKEKAKARYYLTVDDNENSCIFSAEDTRKTQPGDYSFLEGGLEMVDGVWGDTEASVNDTAQYVQYCSPDKKKLFFIDKWDGGMTYSSVGYFVNKEDIVVDESLSMSVAGRLTFLATGKKRFSYLFALIGIFFAGWMVLDIDFSVFTNWREFKSVVGFDYNLTEKLDDAPYEVAAVSSEPKELEAHTDAGTVALDIIERADGKGITTALDIIQDETVSYVLLDRQEALLIKNNVPGRAKIRVFAHDRGIKYLDNASYRINKHVLSRYLSNVLTSNAEGRSQVVK